MIRVTQLFLLTLLAAGLWALLTRGAAGSWIVGLPAIAAASVAAWHLGTGRAGGISGSGLLRFMPFFLVESLRGGVDVALRTLAPRMRIRPGYISYSTRLPERARVFFANCVCLLPGTLAADIDGAVLHIHVLDTEAGNAKELDRLERVVAEIFPPPAIAESR